MKYLLPYFLLFALIAGCGDNNGSDKTPPAAEVPAKPEAPATPAVVTMPDLQLLDSKDQPVELSSLKGKKLFVNLWATWCPPCRAEIPSIERLAAKVDKNKAAFVMLSLDDNFSKAKSYASKNRMTLPVYYPAENLPALFSVNAIPVTFIFDENGELLYQLEGSADYDTPAFVHMLNK